MLKWRILMVAVAAVAMIGAGCSDTTETTTTTSGTSGDDIEFGQGSMPETIPDSFPLPTGSAISSTMVIKDGLTEVVIRVNAELGITAEFFNQGLVQGGFSVDRSEADGEDWIVEFSDDSAMGTLDISEPQQGISQVLLTYNLP